MTSTIRDARSFNDRFLRAIPAPAKGRAEYWDPAVPGLTLRVTPSGHKSFSFLYRVGRHQRRQTLGAYPAHSLAWARERARECKQQVSEGRDPAAEKRSRRTALTFEDVATWYMADHGHKKRSGAWDEQTIKRELLPEWRSRPAASITRDDIKGVVNAIASRGGRSRRGTNRERPAPVRANRVLALLKTIFRRAANDGRVPADPTRGVQMVIDERERVRDRVVDEAEIRALRGALTCVRRDHAAVLWLWLLTGQRRSEVIGMRLGDVSEADAEWSLSARATKAKRSHRVPLSPQALDVLRPFIDDAARRRTASDHNPLLFPAAKPNSVDRTRVRIARSIGTTPFQGRDLRRTFATRVAGSRQPFAVVVGRLLNHAVSGVTDRVYNRYGYEAEKREALNWWANELDRIIGQRSGRAQAATPPLTVRGPEPTPYNAHTTLPTSYAANTRCSILDAQVHSYAPGVAQFGATKSGPTPAELIDG